MDVRGEGEENRGVVACERREGNVVFLLKCSHYAFRLIKGGGVYGTRGTRAV